MTAPERIRVCGDLHPQWGVQFKCYPMPLQPMPEFGLTEYVRADLHDATKAQLAQAVDALREADQAIMELMPDAAFVGAGETVVGMIRAVLAEIEKGGV